MTVPPQEWPTRTAGPSNLSSATLVTSTSAFRDVQGFWTRVTTKPCFVSSAYTACQPEASAKAPWTMTTFFTIGAWPFVMVELHTFHKHKPQRISFGDHVDNFLF